MVWLYLGGLPKSFHLRYFILDIISCFIVISIEDDIGNCSFIDYLFLLRTNELVSYFSMNSVKMIYI